MGKALYRKYRSKSLDDIVGQEHITETLKNALKKKAISHAYLFTGPRGTGKTSIARILAYAINDIDYTDEATHLDIIEIDAASNRRIDEIRELRDKVHIAPTSSKYKVYIIDEVHMLTREAFNALLKTLEEPPEHAVFILATTEAHKVPDTIISRTQRFTFKPIVPSKVIEHLRSIAVAEKISVSDSALELLARHGQGSFRDSISMLDQLSGLGKDTYNVEDVQLLLGVPTDDVIQELLDSVAQNDQALLFKSVQSLREQGIDANRTAKALSTVLRTSMIEETLILPRQTTLQLLQNLVGLTGSTGDFLGLELALLKEFELGNAPVKKVQATKHVLAQKEKKVVAETAPDPSIAEEIVPLKQTSPSKPTPKKKEVDTKLQATLEPILDARLAAWQDMLDDMKAKHNTLYGVMRMAQPEVQDKELVLTFIFGFHKKQLESVKNKPIFQDYLQRYIGSSQFSAVVNKAANKPVDKPADNHVDSSKKDAVDTVSNIFGSAELLES